MSSRALRILSPRLPQHPTTFMIIVIIMTEIIIMNAYVNLFINSEMRAAYEVTNDRKNWEIVMGE